MDLVYGKVDFLLFSGDSHVTSERLTHHKPKR